VVGWLAGEIHGQLALDDARHNVIDLMWWAASEALRRGDRVMRPGFGGKGARRQSVANCSLTFARDARHNVIDLMWWAASEALRRGDRVMRPGFGGKGARRQSVANCSLTFARD